MKKITLLIHCMISAITHATDQEHVNQRIALLRTLAEQAETVVWNCQQPLSHEQLQLLLNSTCVAYALLYTNHKLQEEIKFIHHMSTIMRTDHTQYLDHSDYVPMVERSISRFKALLNAQHSLQQDHKRFDQLIKQPDNTALLAVITTISHHATHIMRQSAEQEQQNIHTSLNACIQNNDLMRARLALTSNTLQTLYNTSDTDQPARVPALQNVEILQQLVDETCANMNTLETMLNDLRSPIEQLEEFGALVFYVYYKVTYDGMKQREIPNQYFTSLFKDTCMVQSDKKTRILTEPIVDTNIPFFV